MFSFLVGGGNHFCLKQSLPASKMESRVELLAES